MENPERASVMEKSRFRKTVDLIKQRPILLLVFIFPPVTLNNLGEWDDWDEWDGTDDLWFGVSAIFYVFLDPLFMYVPLINEETKCVMLDNRLKTAAIVLRSFGDLRYVLRIYYRIKDNWQNSDFLKKIAMSIANDVVCILPVPQVVILIFLPKMRGLSSLKIMKFLNSLMLLQYLPRLYPIFEMCMQVNKDMLDFIKKKNKDTPDDKKLPTNIPKWFGIAINIVGYILASHSGMQGSTNFPEKFLQCFSWGLRNLSSFASNLNSSTYGWENLFVVVISISGLVLFMYLLGHSQTYMQESDRRESVKRKMKMIIEPKIRSLVSDYKLPGYMTWDIQKAVELILEKDEDFIVENIFSILSFSFPDERQHYKESFDNFFKYELFSTKLKKSQRLRDKGQVIYKHLEPMIYTEESYIIREGEPLDKMFFITQGNVLTYATNNGGSSCSSSTIQLIEKEEDSWYGEELLTWAEQPSSKLSTLPISPFTVKSHKKVEIFALKGVDLLKVFFEAPKKDEKDKVEIVSAHA